METHKNYKEKLFKIEQSKKNMMLYSKNMILFRT